MTVLTYRYLGEDAGTLIGQPLGADAVGWPYRVDSVWHCDRADCKGRRVTHISVEPWPLPTPGDGPEQQAERAALADAQRAVLAGRMPEVPA